MTRTVLVTGCSSGIGAACARRLDSDGWSVFAGVRREEDGVRLREAASPRLRPLVLDVADSDSIAAAVHDIERVASGLAGVVNNAGVGLGGPVEYVPLDTWRQQFEVNVIGQVAVTQATLDLVRRARGRYVFIGSANGRVSAPLFGPYAGSKHAIEAVCEALRHELRASGVRVSLVEPGAVRTAIWGKAEQIVRQLAVDLPPEGRQRYHAFMKEALALVADADAHGIPAERVAAVVTRALTARRPRARYLVGPDAQMMGIIARLAPDSIRDHIIRRELARSVARMEHRPRKGLS